MNKTNLTMIDLVKMNLYIFISTEENNRPQNAPQNEFIISILKEELKTR